MGNNVLISLFALAKNNNGFFKSEKQAQFLTKFLADNEGIFIESFSFGYTGKTKAERTTFFTWDDQGITKITTKASVSGKESVKFARMDSAEYDAKKAKAIADHNAVVLASIDRLSVEIATDEKEIDSELARLADVITKIRTTESEKVTLIEKEELIQYLEKSYASKIEAIKERIKFKLNLIERHKQSLK
jgi:hypothetical protein